MDNFIVITAATISENFSVLPTMYQYISATVENPWRQQELLRKIDLIKKNIQEFQRMPNDIYVEVSTELEAINNLLHSSSYSGSISEERNWVVWLWHGICTLCINKKLDEVSYRLHDLYSVTLCGALRDIKSRLPNIDNKNPSLPSCYADYGRIDKVLEFLKVDTKELRIIGLYGQPGLGKSTLLNKLWTVVSEEKIDFYTKAFVELGESVASNNYCLVQSRILSQLGSDGQEIVINRPFGKQLLREYLSRSGKAIFLAIDNVWQREDIEALLPDELASILPPYSCIVVTSRQFSVVEKLAELCPYQISDSAHVLPNKPDFLSLEDSKRLFVGNAYMQTDIEQHIALIDSIVPLCGGLPLALNVLGCLFRSEERREEQAWKEVWRKMQSDESTNFPRESFAVEEALRLSYDRLTPACQEAFIDVVGFFCGWKWCTLERILGKTEMSALKDCSFLSESESPYQTSDVNDNHGYYPPQLAEETIQNFGYPRIFPGQYFLRKKNNYVSMHDLTLKYGKCLLEQRSSRSKIVHDDAPYDAGLMQSLQHERIRFFWYTSVEKTIPPNELQKMKNLRYLHLGSSSNCRNWLKLNVENTPSKLGSTIQEDFAMLRFLSLENITLPSTIIQGMMSPEIRELHFQQCKSLIEISDVACIRLRKLETLCIYECRSFEHISEHCRNWEALQELTFFGCPKISKFPASLGTLPNLESFLVAKCHGLKSLPPLFQLKALSFLNILKCSKLKSLPSLPAKLKSLSVNYCPKLLKLPKDIGHLKSMTMLNLNSSRFRRLPKSICDMSALQVLDLRFCKDLEGFPKGMQKLKSLRELRLIGSTQVHTKIPTLDSVVIWT